MPKYDQTHVLLPSTLQLPRTLPPSLPPAYHSQHAGHLKNEMEYITAKPCRRDGMNIQCTKLQNTH